MISLSVMTLIVSCLLCICFLDLVAQGRLSVKAKKSLCIALFFLCTLFSVLILPSHNMDLYRYYRVFDRMRHHGQNVKFLDDWRLEILSFMIFRAISRTPFNQIAPVLSCFCTFSSLYYIYFKYERQYRRRTDRLLPVSLTLCLGLFFVWQPYFQIVDNLRCPMSFAVCSVALYRQFCEGRAFLTQLWLYIIATTLHTGALTVVLFALGYTLFPSIYRFRLIFLVIPPISPFVARILILFPIGILQKFAHKITFYMEHSYYDIPYNEVAVIKIIACGITLYFFQRFAAKRWLKSRVMFYTLLKTYVKKVRRTESAISSADLAALKDISIISVHNSPSQFYVLKKRTITDKKMMEFLHLFLLFILGCSFSPEIVRRYTYILAYFVPVYLSNLLDALDVSQRQIFLFLMWLFVCAMQCYAFLKLSSLLVYNGQPAGFIGAEYRQYAVTFIDNHDTFERSDNKDNEFLGYKKSMTAANKANVLQANAWLLSMPGVPCVFYPHYYKYKTEIQAMIRARKTAGVTNTSSVTINTCESGKLMATVKGTKGDLILKLGSDLSTPSGYKSIASGSGYAMFVPSSLTEETPKAKPQLTITPEGGSYIGAQQVTMTCSVSGAKIYYTLDGTEPTSASTLYSSAVSISSDATLKAFASTSEGDTKVQTHDYHFVDPSVPITIKCYKPASWKQMRIWAWNEDGNIFTASWPGVKMDDGGDGWWSYTFDNAVKRPISLLFDDGGRTTGKGEVVDVVQTPDIDGVMESTCYYIHNVTGMAKVSPDCQTISAVKDIPVVAVTIYPNPVHDILNIKTEARIESAQVYSLTGQCQLTENGDNHALNVAQMASGMYILRVLTHDGKQSTQLFIKQ